MKEIILYFSDSFFFSTMNILMMLLKLKIHMINVINRIMIKEITTFERSIFIII